LAFHVSVDESSQYAHSLEEQIKREAGDMETERNAIRQTTSLLAAAHEQSLDSLRDQLETELTALRQRLTQANVRHAQLQQDIGRLRHRFRLLRLLMPRDLRQSRNTK
jgi:hypothetical protein